MLPCRIVCILYPFHMSRAISHLAKHTQDVSNLFGLFISITCFHNDKTHWVYDFILFLNVTLPQAILFHSATMYIQTCFFRVSNLIKKNQFGESSEGVDYLNGGSGFEACLLYTSPSPRDGLLSRMPSSA